MLGGVLDGATLVVPNADIARSPHDAGDFIKAERITYFSTVPSFLAMIEDDLSTVRLLVVGGEDCPAALVSRWAPGRRMLNTYGPTEATVVATLTECIAGKPVTIGRALPGYAAYVLDDDLRPVTGGEIGELFIGGPSVARGYLNRSELTCDRFIPDTFDQRVSDTSASTARMILLGGQARASCSSWAGRTSSSRSGASGSSCPRSKRP